MTSAASDTCQSNKGHEYDSGSDYRQDVDFWNLNLNKFTKLHEKKKLHEKA